MSSTSATMATNSGKLTPQYYNATSDTYETVEGSTGAPYYQLRGSGTLYVGTLAATTAAAALSTQACNEIMVQNDPDSTGDLLVGNSSTQVIQLTPGQVIVLPVQNVNMVYARTVSGTATAAWLARS